jgi:uncharacterized protein YmfQ (DUF2313 family)
MYKTRLQKLTRQLLPTGRAFKMPLGGELDKLNIALSISESQFLEDSFSTLNSILPDNSNFTTDDAADWERRLGLITNTSVSIADRKLAILRKINHPGTIPSRQNYRYLEKQLQDAGFNVFVYENRFASGGGYVTQTAYQAFGLAAQVIQHNGYSHGTYQHGGSSPGWSNKVANHIDESMDTSFNTGGNLRSTFFISGSPITTAADVDTNRKNEFRQLILKTKPVQTVALLNVNYI